MDFEDDVYNCPVCLTAYKDPRILPCGHSFCLRCLSHIAGRSNNFLCPSCRHCVNLKALKERNVNALPRNFFLSYVMEAKEQASVCSEHNKLLDIFCGQCDLVICSKCLSSQHAGHVTKDTDTVCTERRENLKQFQASTKLWFLKVKQKEESIKVSRSSMQKDVDSIRRTIADLFKKWYDALRAQEKAMLSYVDKETEKRMNVFGEAEKVLQKFLKYLDDTERVINEILRGQKIRILQVYGSVQARHEDIGNRVLQDVENSSNPNKGLTILIQAPWMDEAILNIKPIDTVTTEASSGTQNVSDIIEENSSLKRLKTKFEKYENETIVALKRDHQEEIEKLTEQNNTLKERLKTNSDKYENERIALKTGHQEEIEKLTEENKTLKERNSKDGGGYMNRQSLTSPSDDLDTTQLCINLTNLKRSCKRLDYLKREIAKKTEKKGEKERKKKSYLEHSESIKEKKEMYRVLYDEILVLRLKVDCLFDASRPPSDDERDNQKSLSLTEIRGPKHRRNPFDKSMFKKFQAKYTNFSSK